MTKHERLAWSVVRPLEQYLILKNRVGSGVYDAQLEVLLGRVDVQMVSDPFAAEAFERFKASPADPLMTQTLYLQLVRHLRDDPEFGRRLREARSGAPTGTRRPRTRRGRRLVLWMATAGVVALLLIGFLWGRSMNPHWLGATQPRSAAETSARPAVAPATSSRTTSTEAPESTDAPDSKRPTGHETSVPVDALPTPDNWQFGHGGQDVQGRTYPSSVWAQLSICKDVTVSQRFEVTGFHRLEVQAVGANAAAAPSSIRFEVLDGDAKVLTDVVVVKGQVSAIDVALPHSTSTIELRNSLMDTDESNCEPVHAVWGSPRVIAAGQ
ncbi:hypothetical protein AB0425_38510 [Actinosynnema sp. NPDC051121]